MKRRTVFSDMFKISAASATVSNDWGFFLAVRLAFNENPALPPAARSPRRRTDMRFLSPCVVSNSKKELHWRPLFLALMPLRCEQLARSERPVAVRPRSSGGPGAGKLAKDRTSRSTVTSGFEMSFRRPLSLRAMAPESNTGMTCTGGPSSLSWSRGFGRGMTNSAVQQSDRSGHVHNREGAAREQPVNERGGSLL